MQLRTCFPFSLFPFPSSAALPPPGVLATRGFHKEYQHENNTHGKVIRRDFLQLGCDFPALSRVSSDPVTLLMLPCRLLRFSAPVKRSFATLAPKHGSSPPRRTLLSNASGSRVARSSSLLGLLLL